MGMVKDTKSGADGQRRWRLAATAAGLFAAAIGGGHLAAWLTGHMYTVGLHTITMKTNAALALTLCGSALAMNVAAGKRGTMRTVASVFAACALVIGGLTLVEHLFSVDLGIDQLLAQEPPGAVGILHPNRMGPPGAVSWFLCGMAVLLLDRPKGSAVRAAQCLGVALCYIGLIGLLGYLYQVKGLYGAARYTGIAWPTTVAIVSLGMGILWARPTEGVMARVTARDTGGLAVRRLLPAALVLPVALGWLCLVGERLGLYETSFGTSILVVFLITIFSWLILKTGTWISGSAQELSLNEERYRSFVKASSQVVWSVDAVGAVVADIPAWCQYTGQTTAQARGFGWLEAIAPQDRPRVLEAWKKAYESRGLYEVEYLLHRHDGEMRHILARGVPILNSDGTIREWIGTGLDVTEQKRAEDALRESEGHFRQLAETLPQFVWMARPDGYMEYFNARWHDYTGATREESYGWEWTAFVHPDDVAGTIERWTRSVESGSPYEVEHRFRGADGGYHWYMARGLPLRDEHGKITRWFGTCTDIEEQKRAREAAEAAARAKTDFMANMSHEIRTPMNGILGVTDLLLDTELHPQQRQYLEMVKSSGEALLSVVNDVLDFSKLEWGAMALDSVDFDLQETVENAVESLSVMAFKKGLELIVSVDPELPRFFRGDPGKLRQVLLNLCGNAVKFTERGEVAVRVEGRPADGVVWELTLTVADTGIGIAEEKLGMIFESFTQADTTTARIYGGTGLGLAICKRIVDRMGGRIDVQSRKGAGSVFRIVLELPQGERTGRGEELQEEGLAGLRALVLDDNETNRVMLERFLCSQGVSVETAATGEEAVRKANDAADGGAPFEVILLDLHLPDSDGFQVAEKLRSRFAEEKLCIMMITSDDIAGGARRSRELGLSAYLVKPVRTAALKQVLARVCRGGHLGAAELPKAPAVPAALPSCARVLLAEDNPVNRTVAETILRKAGVRVTLASSGVEAVDGCQRESFNVILMDVQMPEMDGYEATRRLRQQGFHVPIVGLTAHAMEHDRDACLRAGMDDYLSKPFEAAALLQKVASWAQRHQLPAAQPHHLLRQLGGSGDDFEAVVKVFLENVHSQFTEVRGAVNARDLLRAQAAAHKLKGALGTMAADVAWCLAERLEATAKDGDLTGAADLCLQLEREIGRVVEVFAATAAVTAADEPAQ